MSLHQWHSCVLDAGEDRCIALLLPFIPLQGDQLSPPGLVIEVRVDIDSQVLNLHHMERREDLFVTGRKEDLLSHHAHAHHLHRDKIMLELSKPSLITKASLGFILLEQQKPVTDRLSAITLPAL